jgi:hypothetical protein
MGSAAAQMLPITALPCSKPPTLTENATGQKRRRKVCDFFPVRFLGYLYRDQLHDMRIHTHALKIKKRVGYNMPSFFAITKISGGGSRPHARARVEYYSIHGTTPVSRCVAILVYLGDLGFPFQPCLLPRLARLASLEAADLFS